MSRFFPLLKSLSEELRQGLGSSDPLNVLTPRSGNSRVGGSVVNVLLKSSCEFLVLLFGLPGPVDLIVSASPGVETYSRSSQLHTP